MRRHPALGPVVARRVEEVEAKPSLDRTAWDYGVASASAWLDEPRTTYGLCQAVIAAIVGAIVGVVAADSLPLGAAVAVPTTVLSYWAVPTVGALASALLRAPSAQRDAARAEVRSLRGVIEQERDSVGQLRTRQADLVRRYDQLRNHIRSENGEAALAPHLSIEGARYLFDRWLERMKDLYPGDVSGWTYEMDLPMTTKEEIARRWKLYVDLISMRLNPEQPPWDELPRMGIEP